MKKFLFTIFNIFILFFCAVPVEAISLDRVGGRIVLQVEENGEAWYVTTDKLQRFYLGRPSDAFTLMRGLGVGITNNDLAKIPLGTDLLFGSDADGDTLSDDLEKAIGTNFQNKDSDKDGFSDIDELQRGYNPLGEGSMNYDYNFVNKNLGKIFLQVQDKGQAWYVYPLNGKRYYLGRPVDAFEIMRNLGLGISNADLEELIALTPNFSLTDIERVIHEKVNQERIKNGLKAVSLNSDVSQVARRHSQNLADANQKFTGIDSLCSYPLIHHEGLVFGAYQSERLNNSGILYYNMSGENIALLSSAAVSLSYREGDFSPSLLAECEAERNTWDENFKTRLDELTETKDKINLVANEHKKRELSFDASPKLKINSAQWQSIDELSDRAVKGWMNSPGHRKNILKEEYNEAGMGVAYVNSYLIITQVFISKTECGYEGAECCETEDYQFCYQPNSCERGVCVK